MTGQWGSLQDSLLERGGARMRIGAAALAVALLAAACGGNGGNGEPSAGDNGEASTGENEAPSGEDAAAGAGLDRQELPEWVAVPDIADLETQGNTGEEPTWYTDVVLSDEQIAELQDRELVAVFLNWASGPYNEAVLAGARDALSELGIDLGAVTNYNFDQSTLQSDVQNVMALNPDILFYSGVDPDADRAALQPAVDAGVAIVSFANAPGGWTTGEPENFVSLVSYDTHGNGAAVAQALQDRYPDGAKLGMMFFDATYKLVNEREEGFEAALEGSNIELVAREPMSDPARTQEIVSAMLTRHPDLDVIFAPWDLPAEGALAAIEAAQSDAEVIHIDVGSTGARHIACDDTISIMSSQLVYEWGRTGTIAAGLHALGEDVPPYIIVPTFAVTEENLEEAWDLAYGGAAPLPDDARSCLDG